MLSYSMTYIKKTRCFPVNIAKLFRTPILKNICERLLLKQVAILKNTTAAFRSFIEFKKFINKL